MMTEKNVHVFNLFSTLTCNLAILFALDNVTLDRWFPANKDLSLVMRKPAFCICENKDADQLRGNREADQRLCFRYVDNTIPLFPKSEILSL